MKQYLRYLPPVHELQKSASFTELLQKYNVSFERLTAILQEQLESIRAEILQQQLETNCNQINKEYLSNLIFVRVEAAVSQLSQYYLKTIINATGTIIHTNLGRARLGEKQIEHVVNVARNYSNLEYKISEGKRGSRHDIIEDLIRRVTGAEAAMVVNNNAAAVYLILRALAKDHEVIVSRGELIEIGGSFRISAIMAESGAKLIEVGTTNKTHLYDYEEAISEETAIVMKVHTSNFKVVGFTESVNSKQLIELANQHENVIFYEDLGSGALYDFRAHGIGNEPVVRDVLSQGAHIVSFSGDKLLGGPQAGIIAGKKELIAKLKKHQLARVLRVDKMTFAALEATLKSYLLGEHALKDIPTLRDILQTEEAIFTRAEKFQDKLTEATTSYTCALENDFSQIGGGTMPGEELPTYVASVSHISMTSDELATKLRLSTPSIITRQRDGKILLDFRTITDDELSLLVAGFQAINIESEK
ncbi:L-seryl-tRNA(Sec) selenium transferase [Calidifontibacillus oryziterrae]|uniref:L-seryl-tRNA(Sec) selenium transferase n=1 Tax=Calidifontibacillus oryziterrae TaxID=1191699 RepID=UPI0002F9D6EF|nr:L-seryl-tRNA(Sec) selenium transferase [Calidifontibacillus oryziterrae]